MAAEVLSNEQRAAIFSKVLGKSITYEQQSIEEFYDTYTGYGLAHSFVYNFFSYPLFSTNQITTPQLSVLIKRPLRTLEEWLNENVKNFNNSVEMKFESINKIIIAYFFIFCFTKNRSENYYSQFNYFVRTFNRKNDLLKLLLIFLCISSIFC